MVKVTRIIVVQGDKESAFTEDNRGPHAPCTNNYLKGT